MNVAVIVFITACVASYVVDNVGVIVDFTDIDAIFDGVVIIIYTAIICVDVSIILDNTINTAIFTTVIIIENAQVFAKAVIANVFAVIKWLFKTDGLNSDECWQMRLVPYRKK